MAIVLQNIANASTAVEKKENDERISWDLILFWTGLIGASKFVL